MDGFRIRASLGLLNSLIDIGCAGGVVSKMKMHRLLGFSPFLKTVTQWFPGQSGTVRNNADRKGGCRGDLAGYILGTGW